jgi:hypothetical protein
VDHSITTLPSKQRIPLLRSPASASWAPPITPYGYFLSLVFFFLDFLARSLVLARALTAFCSAVMTLEQAPPRPEDARGWGGGLAPVAEEKEVKVVVVDEPPPARLQAQRPLAPLQVTTHAPPPPMSVATGNVEPPPAYQPVMQPPQQVGN